MVPSHLTNTRVFLDHLLNAQLHQNCVVESFDVTSLNTNVQNDQALQALSEMLDRHINNINTFGLERNSIMTLVKECLNCNIFKWSGSYYSQLRGLAMGQRLAPVLAICFMSRIEEPVLARLPLLYCRYIDDCFIITSTQSEMDECFRILNDQSQYIRLTRETPSNGWLPYLNTQVKVSDGMVSVKWYRKGSSKNILINVKSAHPTAVKRDVVRNMFKTATAVCTDEPPRFCFRTAGTNREITVSEAALCSARARLAAASEGGEQDESDIPSSSNEDSKPPPFDGFVTAGSNTVISVSNAALDAARRRLQAETGGETSPASSLVRKRSTAQQSGFVPPLLKRTSGTYNACLDDEQTKTVLRFLGNVAMPSNAQASFSGHERDVLTRGTVADRYGERVLVEVLTASIPQSISRGSVISIEGATLLRNPDLTLILNDSAFVDMEPNDPETGCLHRLFDTGLFDSSPSEDDFTFDSTALRLIGRLNEFPDNASTVMARICSINYDALVYLGCSSCKRYARRSGDGLAPCQECANRKAKYFYSLHVEISDFSGMVAVHFSDEAAERLIGKPAGAMVKVPKSVLQSRLSSFYYRPMLFRVSLQSSRWFVDDWKELDIPRFKPFLKDIAAQKGFK
ncbi:unnamed protein product [Nippostrongylus brasiliensis]|uniref:Reverse transcriptase domain-containing protein n=1 Tax=Nippostrongylus brasiliensis TaxID=27835 RepID=A0A0N4XES3_NIPBR|nr:unnamed protein product [Nippostrongylus brasiliensis]